MGRAGRVPYSLLRHNLITAMLRAFAGTRNIPNFTCDRKFFIMNELTVIIDPQKDFIADNGNYATRHGIKQIREVKARINRLVARLDQSRFVVVCSDYRPGQFGAGRSMCIPGTEGHEADIDVAATCTFITKTEHSCFSSPAFISCLQEQQISRLLLCGFLAEYCVLKTAIDALDQGYEVVLLEDCIGTGDDIQERIALMLATLQEKGAMLKKAF